MKLLLDENLSPQHAALLRENGYDAIAVTEAGLSGRPDEAVRAFAISSGRVLNTLDADFAKYSSVSAGGNSGRNPTEDPSANRRGNPGTDSKNVACSKGYVP